MEQDAVIAARQSEAAAIHARFGGLERLRFDGWLIWAGDKLWGYWGHLELLTPYPRLYKFPG